MMKFTMTNTETGETSEIRVCTTNYSIQRALPPVLGEWGLEPVESAIEFSMTGYLSASQMAALRRQEFADRGAMNAYKPHEPITKKSVDVRRAELLQQLLDTFKEKKDGQT